VAEIRVRLTPRGGRDALTGVRDGVVLARVAAPPAEGRANASVCRLLAKALGVAPTRVTIVRGRSAREKVVHVDGLATADAYERLGSSR
jgi:uncharacterized protein YggU (UPF0235/DUF167 family)